MVSQLGGNQVALIHNALSIREESNNYRGIIVDITNGEFYISHKQCAEKWPLYKESTLRKERVQKTLGIPSHKVGNKVIYIKAELDAWLSDQIAKGGIQS